MKAHPVPDILELTPRCPLCLAAVYVSARPRLGDAVLCLHCGAALEVVNTRPVALDLTILDEFDDGLARNFEDIT